MIKDIEQQILLFLTNLRGLSVTLVKICQSEPELKEIINRARDFDLNSASQAWISQQHSLQTRLVRPAADSLSKS